MKILLIEMSPFPYHIGGGYSHLCLLSKGLIERGHEVHVLSAKPAKDYQILDYPEGVILHNVGMRHRMFHKGNKLFTYIHRIFYEISFVKATMKKIKEINPDVINTQSLITTSLPCSLLKRDFFVTMHGIHTKGFSELWAKRKRKDVKFTGKFYEWLEKYNAKYCKTIIGVNNEVVKFYSDYAPSVLIGNSLDLKPFDNITIEKKRNKYLFLGRISEEKGLNYLMEALSSIDDQVKNMEFMLAGSGDEAYTNELKQEFENLDLQNIKVKFIGPVYGKEKIKLFKSSSVFVLPSTFESFGIVLLEAMAARCAVISSNCRGPKEIVKPSFGLLVEYSQEENRANNLAQALVKSLKWNILKKGGAAREEVEKYNYKAAIDKYLELYEK